MGLFSSVGGILNDITGATSAGAQSQKYAIASASLNNAYQKEFAKNAHQWEVEDLQKAGLNPILSAGGSGTSASGGGVASATETSAGLTPMDAISAGINAYTGVQNAKRTKAETANIDANTLLTKAKTQSELLDFMIKNKTSQYQIDKIKADLDVTLEELAKLKTGQTANILGTELGGKLSKGWNYITDALTGE